MRVCLVTTGQPSTDPRLVKEADTLAAAGFDVHVVAAHWVDWATAADRLLLDSRAWRVTFIDWRREHAPALFLKSRVRHWMAKHTGEGAGAWRASAALSRVGPELARAARSVRADLYIAHNLGALPAAHAAASGREAMVAFDAEDFHSGQLSGTTSTSTSLARLTREVEQQWLPRCRYVSAAAPGIAESYRDLCGIPLPTCILNVFPLRDRPAALRQGAPLPLRLYWFSQTIGPDRGLEDVVAAMGLVRSDAVELQLRGRWQEGYERQLRRLAAQSGVSDSKIVSHGPAAPDEMVRLAAACDIGLALEPPVNANNDILLSNKIFTYLLAGNAIVASATRGQARLLPELGAAAVSYASGDPRALAAALTRWIEDRAALETARKTAWCLGETRFNWDREQHKFLDLVRGAVCQ